MERTVNIRPAGSEALLLEVDAPHAWYAALAAARIRGDLYCDEIVPGAETVLLIGVDPTSCALRQALHQLSRHVVQQTVPSGAADGTDVWQSATGTVQIPVRWDGPDLGEVGEAWGRDPAQVLRETVFTVAFCGFAPGFAYLTGLAEELHLPRRPTPRPSVPAGSVAVGGAYAGIYPRATPGGWHLLGSTDALLFDVEREPPALLVPGMTVRMIDA
jgi:KipI family sensor histidine kinase inhibitor